MWKKFFECIWYVIFVNIKKYKKKFENIKMSMQISK